MLMKSVLMKSRGAIAFPPTQGQEPSRHGALLHDTVGLGPRFHGLHGRSTEACRYNSNP